MTCFAKASVLGGMCRLCFRCSTTDFFCKGNGFRFAHAFVVEVVTKVLAVAIDVGAVVPEACVRRHEVDPVGIVRVVRITAPVDLRVETFTDVRKCRKNRPATIDRIVAGQDGDPLKVLDIIRDEPEPGGRGKRYTPRRCTICCVTVNRDATSRIHMGMGETTGVPVCP